jgi:hypothetical protein
VFTCLQQHVDHFFLHNKVHNMSIRFNILPISTNYLDDVATSNCYSWQIYDRQLTTVTTYLLTDLIMCANNWIIINMCENKVLRESNKYKNSYWSIYINFTSYSNFYIILEHVFTMICRHRMTKIMKKTLPPLSPPQITSRIVYFVFSKN